MCPQIYDIDVITSLWLANIHISVKSYRVHDRSKYDQLLKTPDKLIELKVYKWALRSNWLTSVRTINTAGPHAIVTNIFITMSSLRLPHHLTVRTLQFINNASN